MYIKRKYVNNYYIMYLRNIRFGYELVIDTWLFDVGMFLLWIQNLFVY